MWPRITRSTARVAGLHSSRPPSIAAPTASRWRRAPDRISEEAVRALACVARAHVQLCVPVACECARADAERSADLRR